MRLSQRQRTILLTALESLSGQVKDVPKLEPRELEELVGVLSQENPDLEEAQHWWHIFHESGFSDDGMIMGDDQALAELIGNEFEINPKELFPDYNPERFNLTFEEE